MSFRSFTPLTAYWFVEGAGPAAKLNASLYCRAMTEKRQDSNLVMMKGMDNLGHFVRNKFLKQVREAQVSILMTPFDRSFTVPLPVFKGFLKSIGAYQTLANEHLKRNEIAKHCYFQTAVETQYLVVKSIQSFMKKFFSDCREYVYYFINFLFI